MHTVTKVLVVFAAILSVVLAALTIAFAVNADRISGDYLAERDRRIATETSSAADVAQARDQIALLEQQRSADNTRIASLESENRRLAGEKTELVSKVARAEAQYASVLQKIDQLAATNETQAKVIASYSNEVTALRDNELRYRREGIELSDRIADLSSQNEVLEQSVRALQEELTAANEARQAAAMGVAQTTGGDSTPRVPPIRLDGRITKVERSPTTGETLVQIDLGSNNQLRNNSRLYVTRNGEYIADIIVIRTDLRQSVGRLDAHGRNVEVRADDTVTSVIR